MSRRILAAIPLLAISAAHADEPPRYIVQVIGGSTQSTSGLVSMPLGLNNNGRAVGYAAAGGEQTAIMNWKGGDMYPVGLLPGSDRSFGSRVNILGRIAGAAITTDANGAVLESKAVRWKGLIPQDLGSLGGHTAAALGINDVDRIVGYSTLPGEAQTRAFQWTNGIMTALPIPSGATQAYAYDISNNNHIIGVYGGPSPAKPVMWLNGVMQPLSIPSAARTGGVSAVNDSGVAVGNYEISQYNGTFAAVAWYAGHRYELGNLGGSYPYAIAADVNNSGHIVGTSNSPSGYTGFIWVDGQMYDLRTRILPGAPTMQIVSAQAINDSGRIAAAAVINGNTVAVLLIPVSGSTPAPGTLSALVAAGCLALRRRR